MKNGRAKLIAAGLLLIVSLVLLVSASVAWFTVSTNPEIGGMQIGINTDMALLVSNTKNGTYTQSIQLGDAFENYVPLKPVSTVDGINWFLPTYETATGGLNEPSEFVRDSSLFHANVSLAAADGSRLEGAALYDAQEQGYYVYTDIWLKTEQEGGCSVTLSIPANVTGLDTWETDQGLYGTYALASYEQTETGAARIDNNAQTALRVGFLTGDNRFTIYEPNAEQRSVFSIKPKAGEQGYVSGYTLAADQSNYQNGDYIRTSPIALGENGEGVLGNVDAGRLIVQKSGAWNLSKLQTALRNGETPNSNDVERFGLFIKDSESLRETENLSAIEGDAVAAASETIIVQLAKDEPQKLRIFIWLEGQDVDCWNDIAAGSFVINLEFAAQP